MNLQPGQNVSISRQSPATRGLLLTLTWQPATTPLEIDTSAFALTAAGKVSGDEGFIFYNQPELPGGGGFLGKFLGGGASGSIDLDLGCLFQMQDGRPGGVQALGDTFGSLHQPPYIQLMGDDRTGASAQGEFLHINGRYWNRLKKVLIYAFIYEGVPNWSAADAVVTIETPGQPTLEVRLDEHRNDLGMCAIAMLENVGGSIQAKKLVEYFPSHEPMDRAYGFGLSYVAGRK